MKHSLELNITGNLDPAALRTFVAALPEECSLSTIITVIPKDRPWESERAYAVLRAEWTG